MEDYPPYSESGDDSADVGYEASWLFMNSVYKKSMTGR
jgi:hypothetical protein